MKTVYLLRHGETLFNKQKKIQGFCDSPLTTLGIQQAKSARTHFESLNLHFDEAYSSTSERASDTLEIITDLPYKRIKGLREWNFGSLEGEGEHLNPPLPYQDFFAQFGGETEVEFQRRITQTITEIATHSKGSHILIVTHGAAIAQFYKFWENNSTVRRQGKVKNCSIFQYAFNANQFSLHSIIEQPSLIQ